MDKDVTQYLNDHLAGSSGAILLIRTIANSHDTREACEFLLALEQEVKANRSVLEDLIDRIDQQPSQLTMMAGAVAGRFAGIKLKWEQIEPGGLGQFEALELLAIGIQGKHLLWDALEKIIDFFPEWSGIDFEVLSQNAVRQRDRVECWRLHAAIGTLVDGERQIGPESK